MTTRKEKQITVCEALLKELRFRSDRDNLMTLGFDEDTAGVLAADWTMSQKVLEDLLDHLLEGVVHHYPNENPQELPYDVWNISEGMERTMMSCTRKDVDKDTLPMEYLEKFKEAFGKEIGYGAGLLQLDIGEELYDCNCGKVDVDGVALDSDECVHHGDKCGICGSYIIEAAEVGDGEAMYHGRYENCKLSRILNL